MTNHTTPTQKPQKSYPQTSTAHDVIRLYLEKLGAFKLLLVIMIAGIVTGNVAQLIVPLYYKKFFDVIGAYANDLTGRSLVVSQLEHVIFIILALHFLNWAAYRFMSFCNAFLQVRVMAKLKQDAFDYLLRHSYTFFTNNFTGSLVQRVARLARGFERLADRVIFDVLPLLIQIIGATYILWGTHRSIALLVLGWAFVFLSFNYVFARWKLKYDIAKAEADSRTTGVLADTLTNQSTVQLFDEYKSEGKRFKEVTDDQAKITLFSWNLNNTIDTVQGLLIVAVEFAVFYIGIRYWQDGTFTVGTFALLQAYIISLAERLWNFSRVVRDIYESFADAKEMVDILKLPYEVKDLPAATALVVQKGEVVFKDVTFNFRETRMILDKLSLTIKGGEKVALVGPSGAGKSTFVKLLLRLYDVSGGQILIDGQDIAHRTQSSLRTQVSFVPQDPVLFHRSLKENIRYGRLDATDEEVFEAARLAHCKEFIDALPDKYETYVGERGVKLSGGERQRVAIARAILKNAAIIILDEATSSLDSESEALIQDALVKLMTGKTTLVIAHRLSTIKNLDRVLVLEGGKIIEEGTHDELAAKDGSLYRKLWELQSGGYIKDEESVD